MGAGSGVVVGVASGVVVGIIGSAVGDDEGTGDVDVCGAGVDGVLVASGLGVLIIAGDGVAVALGAGITAGAAAAILPCWRTLCNSSFDIHTSSRQRFFVFKVVNVPVTAVTVFDTKSVSFAARSFIPWNATETRFP